MKSILHDLEEDYDPRYSIYGIPGSNADTGLYNTEDVNECAEMIGCLLLPEVLL